MIFMLIKSLHAIILLFLLFLFLACGDEDSNSGMDVRVYSQGPVLRAVVKDARGQIALQKDLSQNIYHFDSNPIFPISATSNMKDTFIDADFDTLRSASDIIFNDTLYSVTSLLSLQTTLLLESADINTTSYEYNVTKYKNAITQYTHAFSISSNDFLYKTALESREINLAVLTDTLYIARQGSDFNASNIKILDENFTTIYNFYNEYLATKEIGDAARYGAFYNTLNLLDAKKIQRSQQNIMPSIPAYLNKDYAENILNLPDSAMLSSVYNSKSNLAYWAIKIDADKNIAYMAAGNDGMDTIDISAPKARLENQDNNIIGFATAIETMDRNDARCIFLADQENQLVIYGLWPLSHADDVNASSLIGHYKNSATTGAKTFDVDFTASNANNLELLLVSNGIAGLEIFNTDTFTCKDTIDLNSSSRLNIAAIGSDTYSSVVASNQKIIYIADGANGLISVDISGSQPIILNTTALKNSEIAYNLHMVPNSNELYVSTDSGIQIYNTDNTGSIVYRGLYATEGSRANVLGETLKVSLSENHKALFIADITAGVKVIDITDSTHPKLCGSAYFSAANIIERSAVRDVVLLEHDDGRKEVYIANDSNGLIVIDDVSHLLFEHCKGLLD